MHGTPRVGAGAIEEFDYARFGGPTIVRESQVTLTTTPSRAVRANPDRVMVLVTNNGPDVVTWGLSSGATAGTRNLIGVAQTIVFQVQNDGALCGAELWMGIPVNATQVNIVELIRQRR